MHGYQLTFFTQQNRLHGALTIAEWLTAEARKLGISGVTVTAAQSGYGRDGKLHSPIFSNLPSSLWKSQWLSPPKNQTCCLQKLPRNASRFFM